LASGLGVFLAGRDVNTAARVGMGLAQIGEFSFIIASLGITLNVTSKFLFPIAVAVSMITTFLTPYLIKYSNTFVESINKSMPTSVANISISYSKWWQHFWPGTSRVKMIEVVRRSFFYIVINLFIVIAIFLAGAYFATWGIMVSVSNEQVQKTIISSLALLLSLPFLIAIYRKIKSLSMILARFTIKSKTNKQFAKKMRRIFVELIALICLIGIVVLILALKAIVILPSVGIAIIIGLVLLGIVILFHPRFIKLHSFLQKKFLAAIKKSDSRRDNYF
jgi:monovalent cation:H+ antiporter-2, CPA2 family